MNFLGHYYFDRLKGRPYFNLGLVMPDFSRNFIPGGRIRIKNTDLFSPGSEACDIARGCQTHVSTDALFHGSPEFNHIDFLLVQKIRQGPVPFERDWFLSHILAELMLDRELLLREPQVADAFYEDLGAIEILPLTAFLQKALPGKENRFWEPYLRFVRMRYLYSYIRPESLVYSLGRIAQSRKLTPFNGEQREALMKIIQEFSPAVTQFFGTLERLFSKK